MTTNSETQPAEPSLDALPNSEGPCSVATRKLPVPVEWMRFCYECNSDQVFRADRVCVSGMVGSCPKGHDRIVPFTRTTAEAA